MPVTERTYQAVALEDPEGNWELHKGHLRERPAMTASHSRLGNILGYVLRFRLDWNEYDVRVDAGRVRRTDETYYVPDVFVVPTRLVNAQLGRHDQLETYDEPLPFVAEVWSPSTGAYDVDAKLPEYRRRGDFEIWRLHPYQPSVIAWRRQADGSYAELRFDGGKVRPWALPRVTIDLDELFVWITPPENANDR